MFLLKIEGKEEIRVILRKTIEKYRLLFEIKVLTDFSGFKVFELPLLGDEGNSDFQYVYTVLDYLSAKTYNDALIRTDLEKTEKEKMDVKPKAVIKSSGKVKKVLIVFLICLVLLGVFVLWKKKMLFASNKERFKKPLV